MHCQQARLPSSSPSLNQSHLQTPAIQSFLLWYAVMRMTRSQLVYNAMTIMALFPLVFGLISSMLQPCRASSASPRSPSPTRSHVMLVNNLLSQNSLFPFVIWTPCVNGKNDVPCVINMIPARTSTLRPLSTRSGTRAWALAFLPVRMQVLQRLTSLGLPLLRLAQVPLRQAAVTRLPISKSGCTTLQPFDSMLNMKGAPWRTPTPVLLVLRLPYSKGFNSSEQTAPTFRYRLAQASLCATRFGFVVTT